MMTTQPNNRGGAREGAGRKDPRTKTALVVLKIEPEVKALWVHAAQAQKMTLGAWIRARCAINPPQE